MSLTDRVAVLRKGEYIGTVDTKSATEQSLTEMMVGKKVSLNIERTAPVNPQNRIELKNVTTLNAEELRLLMIFHLISEAVKFSASPVLPEAVKENCLKP